MLKYFIACKKARLIWVKKAHNGAMCLEQVQRFIKGKNILGLDALKLTNFADRHLIVFSRHVQLLALQLVLMNKMYQDKHEHFIFCII